MTNYKKLFPVIIFLISVYINACCCGSNIDGDKTIKGYIEIIGHEPFTKLAVRTADEKAFVLECSKELKEMLWKNQGQFFSVKFSEMKKVAEYNTLFVEEVIPLKK